MRAHIIYYNYLNPEGEGMSIGGIQTYLYNLIPVLRRCGYDVTVYQRSSKDFHKELDDCDVYGIPHPESFGSRVGKVLLDAAMPHIDLKNDLLLYGCETSIAQRVPCRTVAIQHGIFWDVSKEGTSYLKGYIKKCMNAWKIIERVSKVDQLVCVDNNFINWHRAITPYPKVKHVFIPNFTAIPPTKPEKQHDGINIIFARRFFPHRGTRLFSNVMERILSNPELSNCQINVTIAGTGPDADYMHKKLDAFPQVCFTTFGSDESLRIHQDKDIAVVPTTGSEGTSLSLLEAMASGCAVVCTNVGGMTNIVLGGYNGLMISPDEEELYDALTLLIRDASLRARLQDNAYICAKEAFSLERWQAAWEKVIERVKGRRDGI